MKYVAYGSVITNRLIFPNKTNVSDIMGGSGIYAFSGLQLCTQESMLVASIGKDFGDYYGAWMDRNAFRRDGLVTVAPHTCYNELVYAPDGQYREYSIYGEQEDRESAARMLLSGDDLKPFLHDVKGIGISVVITEDIADVLMEAKKHHPFKVMWEIPASMISTLAQAFAKDSYDGLRRYLQGVDIISANKPETFEIFGISTIEEGIQAYKELGMPCYFREGTRGACMIEGDKHAEVPMISVVPREWEIDPTGCGNASTAAAMWAYCEGFDILKCCVIGNVVAAYNVQQYGPYPTVDHQTRREMMDHVERICWEMRKT